ncbi:MAG: hypothetical protein FJY82_03675, partial [Candidatus Aminicenantes bacterium]|nr:hypothetical protein [Candidatus Aminicenantes bacterium]
LFRPHDPYAPPDTPDDLDLVLNGGPIGSYSLAKYTTVDVPLALRRGRNTLVWKIRNLFPARPDAFLARFDRLEILSGTSGVGQPVFGPGWEVRTEDGIHFAKEGAVMTIEAAEPRSVRLVFRGRPVWSVEGVRAMYRREVEFLDRELDRLWAKLDELALWDTTLVVVAGDHGEGLGEFVSAAGEPHIGHIHYLYAYYLRVPLIIVDPESGARGLVRDDPAVLLDVFSTVAERAGFRTGRRQGRSLLGPPAPPDRDLFSATFRPEAAHDKFALRRFPWHLILTPGQGKLEAYDLRSDPEEYRNLGGPDGIPGEARPLQPILEERAREILFKKTEIRIDKKAEDMLRALGYIK